MDVLPFVAYFHKEREDSPGAVHVSIYIITKNSLLNVPRFPPAITPLRSINVS